MRRSSRAWLLMIGMTIYWLLFGAITASAASSNLSQAYLTSSVIKAGSLVSLDSQQTNYVVPSDTNNASQLIGVAVTPTSSLIATGSSNIVGHIQVATVGSATVLVSTLGGYINAGDQIAVSPLDGIGIKALPGSRVIGLAQTAFNAQTTGAATEKVRDKSGKQATITVGYTEVSIAISTVAQGSNSLNALQNAAKTLTGHTVSTFRVIIGLSVAVIASLALITLIYASIYGSIIAIGRNPLAKYSVFRTLRSVLSLALVTAIIAGLTIFFLLD